MNNNQLGPGGALAIGEADKQTNISQCNLKCNFKTLYHINVSFLVFFSLSPFIFKISKNIFKKNKTKSTAKLTRFESQLYHYQ